MYAERSDLYPFTPRDATLAAQVVHELELGESADTPEVSPALVEFARELYTAPVNIREKYADLEAVDLIQTMAESETFYADYFATEEGRKALERLGVSEVSDSDEMLQKLSAIAASSSIKKKTDREEEPIVSEEQKARSAVATESRVWYKRQVADALAGRTEGAGEDWHDSSLVHVNFAPEKLLDKFEALQAYRSSYQAISRTLRTEEGGDAKLRKDKQELLNVYWAKVNNMTATLYPHIVHLAEQLRASPGPDTERSAMWRSRLVNAAPIVAYLFGEEEAEGRQQRSQLLRRLDLVRNGADTGSPDFTPISRETLELAAELERENEQVIDATVERLPEDVIARLDQEEWSKTELYQLLDGVLAKWGILSSVPVVDEEVSRHRKGPAEDGRWQFVFSNRKDALSVDGKRRVMVIPERFKKTGSDALATGAHELEHVVQCMLDDIMAEQLPLAKLGGRRRLTGREMGGIYEERRLYAMLGKTRGTNTTYIRALQTKLDDGTQLDVANSFYQAATRGSQGGFNRKTANLAADRMLRLYRQGGHNSQLLDYLEQELLLRSMADLTPDEVRVVNAAATGFSFKDAATLSKLGMLKFPTQIEWHPAEDVAQVYKEQLGAAA